ncbi:MAG: methyltransferase domain-containing protein [Sporomusaceae bacterium]|nr:methyltransferase domain-containing protein [Sporomusaceae bacterium]
MRDNKTSQPAQEYDENIHKTMPFYDLFHNSTLSLIEVVNPNPSRWLDTGGGTGALIQKAILAFPSTRFVLADPATQMLNIAKEKLSKFGAIEYLPLGTESMDFPDQSFDVITAILAHHYFDASTRRTATINCFRMLKRGGVFITFETVSPRSDKGLQIGIEWWRRAQLRQGKEAANVEKYLNRYGVEFFPIQLMAHIELLRDTGFPTVEVFWASGLQVGLYAIK